MNKAGIYGKAFTEYTLGNARVLQRLHPRWMSTTCFSDRYELGPSAYQKPIFHLQLQVAKPHSPVHPPLLTAILGFYVFWGLEKQGVLEVRA